MNVSLALNRHEVLAYVLAIERSLWDNFDLSNTELDYQA